MSHFDDTLDTGATIPDDFELRELTPGLTLCEKYRLEKEAGAGGMGVVWKAWDVVGERWVALKFIPREIRHSEGAMAHVKTAFQTVQALNHQNIGPVYSLEKDETFGYFIVKKWLEGQTLDETKLLPEQIPDVLAKVAAALDYAHSKRVMHRDVKPSNIFIGTDGDVFLIDFGLAGEIHNSISQNGDPTAGRTSGTRPYMAPEQWRGQHQDGQTDQYALGVVAYQLYSGRLPFQIKDPVLLRMAVLQDPPEPLQNVPPNMNAAILRALSKDRKDRFATCREFIDAITGAVPPASPTPSSLSGIESIIAEEKAAEEVVLASKKAKAEARRREAEEKLRQQLAELDEQIQAEYRAGNYTQAAIHLQELLKLKPDDQNARWLLQRAVQVVKKEEEQKERERKAREEAERLELERKNSLETEQEPSALLENMKMVALILLLWLVVLALIGGLGKARETIHKQRSKKQEQSQIAQAIELQKSTAPDGETRLVKKVDGVEFAFRWCPPGEFTMGDSWEKPARKVSFSDGFWLLETEVTQEMWENVMGSNPSRFIGNRYPVERISWDDCREFCQKLSEKLGLIVQLPEEAQWEYACRAGTTGDFAGNIDEMAWYANNSDAKPHPVGQKNPNAWGLYDMHGNLWEWCSDYFDERDYSKSLKWRAVRGGCWGDSGVFCRSANRFFFSQEDSGNSLGFRVLYSPRLNKYFSNPGEYFSPDQKE